MAEKERGDLGPQGSEISEFNLPDLENAKAAGHPWVGEAEKTKKYLEDQITEAKKSIAAGKNTEAEEAKLRALKERWQRLEVLASEDRGASDQALNEAAHLKAEQDEKKQGKEIYNDATRVELLADLRKEVTPAEQGLVKRGEDAGIKKETIPLPEQFSQGPLAKPETDALAKRESSLAKVKKDENIIDLEEGKDFRVLEDQEPLPAHQKPEPLTGRVQREALPEHKTEALEDKRGKTALPPYVEATPEKAPKKEKLVFANISAMIESAAWDAANAKLTEDKEKMGGEKKGFFKKIGNVIGNIGKTIWKYNWFYEAYKRKEYEKAKKRIYKDYNEGRIDIDKLNIMAAEDGKACQEKHHEAMGAVFDRFASEYDEAVENEAGEEKLKIEDENIKQEARILIRDYATGNISQSDLARRHNELLGKIGGKDLDVKNEIDNLLTIAEKIKNSDSNDKGRDALALDLEIIRGRARGGVKTEAELNRVERIIDKMKKTRGLSWINETTLAVGATAAYCLGRRISQTLAYSKVANFFSFGGTAAMSGAYAGVLEDKRLKEERAQHSRERAKGKTFAPEARRRQEMETFRQETKEAQSLSRELQESFYSSYDLRGERKLKDLTETELAQALGSLADLEARLSLSNAHKIDLISYSDLAEVEKERTRLLLLRSQIKADLKNKYPSGFKINGETKDVNFVQDLAGVRKQELTEGKDGAEGILKKDSNFNKMKAKRVAKTAAKAAVVGLIFGMTFQEIQAAVDDNTQSLLEGILGKNLDAKHQTALEGLRDWMTSFRGGGASGSELATVMVGGQEMQVGLPKGAALRDPEGDGVYSLFYHDKEICNNVSFGSDGALTDEAKTALADHGVRITETLSKEAGEGSLAGTADQRATSFVEDHPDLFKKITHKLWYDCDTPKPVFDHNELRLDLGGEHGTGINANGDYVFSIKRMVPGGAPDGSWHGDEWIDAREAAKNGDLSILLSANHNTEQYVAEVPINDHFEAIVPKDSEIGRMLFKTDPSSKMIFLGDHAEVSQMMGETNKAGAEMIKVLATHNGEQAPFIPAPFKTIPIFEIPPRTDLPPVIPILGRRPMERAMGGKEAPIYPLYPYGRREITAEDRARMRQDMSPRLRENPEAQLNPKEEIDWYFGDQERRYPGYVAALQALNGQEKTPMGKNVEAAVCIAVAGHQEDKNIYRTLETYAVQKDKEKKSVWKGDDSEYEILLYVNWPKDKSAEKTMKEIDRFKEDHPEVPVRVYQEEITNGKVEVGWYKKKIFDLALLRKKERGDNKDILIVANDADMMYSSEQYLENVKETMQGQEGKKYDAMLGRYDLDPEVYRDNPTFHASMRFWQFMDAATRRATRFLYTQGRNTVIRGSSYAAIGGNRTPDFWADVELGHLIHAARERGDAIGYSNKSWLMVDPRREIDKFKSGEKIAHTWDDFNAREVRGGKTSKFKTPENIDLARLAQADEKDQVVADFRARLEDEIQGIVDIFGPNLGAGYENLVSPKTEESEKALEVVEKACGFLGIAAEINVDSRGAIDIKIKDTSRLRQGLLDYKEYEFKDDSSRGRYKTKIRKHPLFKEK